MKTRSQKDDRTRRRMIVLAAVLILLGILFGGICWGVHVLGGICAERCRIQAQDDDVEVIAGKIVSAKVIANHFGLTNGANLARIPFDDLRERLLADMPNIRDVRIERYMPNRVRVEAFERVPVARVLTGANDPTSNRVTDREGVVFWYPRRETALLPIVRERKRTGFGGRLTGSTAAALRLVSETGAFPVLHVQEAAVTANADYILIVLGDSSRAKIAWDGMDGDSRTAHESLLRQLDRLAKCVASRVAEGTRNWNATDYGSPGRIYAEDPSKGD